METSFKMEITSMKEIVMNRNVHVDIREDGLLTVYPLILTATFSCFQSEFTSKLTFTSN